MSKHAIIVIKNDKDEYLQYYDSKWESNLFLNCKLNDIHNDEDIKRHISEELDIKIKDIKLEYIDKKIHVKLSIPTNKNKEYEHYFYKVMIDKKLFNKNKSFYENGTKYTWFNYNELLNDERIQEVNSDIVEYIKELNM